MRVKYRVALLLALLMIMTSAIAEGAISTRVIMKVSKVTQSAVVNVGEDLSMEVVIDGVTPASYQWYFNDAAIDGADHQIYTIVDAEVEDSGVYRMDAFNADGKMLVSMDISARVIDPTVPKSGDASVPVGAAAAVMAAAAAVLVWFMRRRKSA